MKITTNYMEYEVDNDGLDKVIVRSDGQLGNGSFRSHDFLSPDEAIAFAHALLTEAQTVKETTLTNA